MTGDLRYAVDPNPFGDGPVKIPCIAPEHDDTTASLAVYADHSYCYGCRRHWTGPAFLEALGRSGADLPEAAESDRKPYQLDPQIERQVPIWQRMLLEPTGPRHHRLKWLKQRYGLWPETIRFAQIGHTGTRWSIPIPGPDGLAGIKYRLDPDYNEPELLARMKYTMPAGQPSLLYRPNPDGQISVICEGEFDALALAQLGYDAVTCTTGAGGLVGAARHVRDLRRGAKRLLCATDLDTAGDQAYYALQRELDTRLPRVRFTTGTDVSEALTVLPATRRASAVARWIREAEVEEEGWT